MNDTVIRILEKMSGVKVRQRKFLSSVFVVLMSFVGRATYRNMSRYSGYHEKSFSRLGGRKFDYKRFNFELITEEFGILEREYIAVVDGSFISKSGKHTAGLGMFWNSCESKPCRGLEMSVLGVVEMKSHTFYTLDARQTIDGVDEDRLLSHELHVKSCKKELDQLQVKYLVADGHYTKRTFVSTVSKLGLYQIGRLQCNADVYWPNYATYPGKGRPRKYWAKVNMRGACESGWKECGALDDKTKVFQAVLYSKCFKQNINVIMLRKGAIGEKRKVIYLFSTDTAIEPLTLISYYKARFQIEFAFRDAKQHTGLQDCQARSKEKLHNHFNASLTALNIMKIEDRRQKGIDDQTVISIASRKRKNTNQLLMDRLFTELEIDTNCEKVINLRKKFENFGVIAA
jgi:hypothetical protein